MFEQNFNLNNQENVSENTEKKKRWEEEREKLNHIGDKLGHPIDEGIKDVVTALIVNDIPTTSSCEGHIDMEDGNISGRPPYATLGFNNSYDDYVGQKEIVEKIKSDMGISEEDIWNEEFCQRFYDYIEDLNNNVQKTPEFEETIKKNSEIEVLVSNILKDFYKNRESSKDGQKIEIEILWGDCGVNLSFKNKPKNEEELKIQQDEMQAFGEFLKDRFLNS